MIELRRDDRLLLAHRRQKDKSNEKLDNYSGNDRH